MPRTVEPIPPDAQFGEFAEELRRLRERAGLTLRELADRTHWSATVLCDATRGLKLPTWEVTRAYVTACGGDLQEWYPRWKAESANR
jgi:transcriptional regulator with XRE-family HTH domain